MLECNIVGTFSAHYKGGSLCEQACHSVLIVLVFGHDKCLYFRISKDTFINLCALLLSDTEKWEIRPHMLSKLKRF